MSVGCAAEAVADRARARAGAARPDAQRAAAVDPDDAAAAGADLGDVDGRRAQHVAAAARHAAGAREAGADLVFLGVGDLAVLDQARLGGGAADVERHRIGDARLAREVVRGDDAGGRARLDHMHRRLAGELGRHRAAVRLHEEQRHLEAGAAQPTLERCDVALHHRHDVGIDHRGAGALVLAHLGQHVRRKRHVHIRVGFAQHLAHRLLVRRVGVGVDERYGHGLDAVALQIRHGVTHGLRIQSNVFFTFMGSSFSDLDPQVPRNQRLGLLPLEVVELGDADAAQLQHVAESPRGDEAGASSLALDDRVGRDGGAVNHRAAVGGLELQLLQQALDEGEDTLLVGLGRGDALCNMHRAVVLDQHHVRERAADIHADGKTRHLPFRRRAVSAFSTIPSFETETR